MIEELLTMAEMALSIAGSVASILGLVIAVFTLVMVSRLRSAVKKFSRHRQITEIVDRILRIPQTKEIMPDSTCADIRFVIDTFRSFDLSFWFFLDMPAKRIAKTLEGELAGQKRRQILQNNLNLLRDEITVR